MSRFVYQGTLQDGNGKRLADGNVAVLLAGTATPASIYAAATGGVAVASVATDTAGEWAFYIDEADYAGTQRFDVVMSKSGYLSITLEDIEVLPASTHVGISVLDTTDRSKVLTVDISGATTAKTVTIASAHTDDRTHTLPDATGNLLGDGTGSVTIDIVGNASTVGNAAYETGTNAIGGALTGDFYYSRIGNMVTLWWPSATHSSGSAVTGAAGAVPANFRPSTTTPNSYKMENVAMRQVTVSAAGTLQFDYRDWAGAGQALSSTGAGSITYIIP